MTLLDRFRLDGKVADAERNEANGGTQCHLADRECTQSDQLAG